MFNTQRVYYPKRAIEHLLYACCMWATFNKRQQDNIYDSAGLI